MLILQGPEEIAAVPKTGQDAALQHGSQCAGHQELGNQTAIPCNAEDEYGPHGIYGYLYWCCMMLFDF